MSGSTGPLRREVEVTNPQGLHVRPAAAFAARAAQFVSQVRVAKDGQIVDGKFWPDLLLLAAEQGSKLTIEVEGPDAQSALDALCQLLSQYEETDITNLETE